MLRTLVSQTLRTSNSRIYGAGSSITFSHAQRFYTPPPEAIKLYQSNFTAGPFPVDFTTSDTAQYAQFLFKLSGDQGQYMKDFEALQKLKLPIFWERSGCVTEMAELVKGVSPNFLFALRWMQVEGSLGNVREVQQYYDTLVRANKKRLAVSVFASSAGVKDAKLQAAAKALVAETLKGTAALQTFASWTPEFTFHVDESIRTQSDFYAEFGGHTVTTIELTSGERQTTENIDVDYTSVKAMKSLRPTKFAENVETDVLRSYYDQLSKLDLEEQMMGV